MKGESIWLLRLSVDQDLSCRPVRQKVLDSLLRCWNVA